MALPGLFVEYLVIGALALLWALPATGLELGGGESALLKLAALAPAVYVLGMFVDFAAFVIVTWLPLRNGSYKNRVRRVVESKRDVLGRSSQSATVDGADLETPPGTQRAQASYFRVLWGGFPDMNGRAAAPPGTTARRQIRLLTQKPDIAKQVEMRSSRDRIARSTVLNLILIALFLAGRNIELAALTFTLAIVAIPMWVFFEGNSYGYELRAAAELEKLSTED